MRRAGELAGGADLPALPRPAFAGRERETIRRNYPKASIPRRNTGYALDLLMDAQVFDPASDKPFNLCRLLAGSEGTLFVGIEFELECSPLPPPYSALLCAHFSSVDEALRAVTLALPHRPYAIELIDRHLLEATKRHIEHAKYRFFVEGDPGAVLAIDIRHDTEEATAASLGELTASLKLAGSVIIIRCSGAAIRLACGNSAAPGRR